MTLTNSWLIWLWSLFRYQPQHPQPGLMASFWLIGLRLFWVLRWVVWPIYWSLGWNVNRNWQNLEELDISYWFWFRPVFHSLNSLIFFPNSLEIDTSEGPVAQIPLFLTRNCYEGWVILSLPTLFSSFIIEFSDDLVGQLSGKSFSI